MNLHNLIQIILALFSCIPVRYCSPNRCRSLLSVSTTKNIAYGAACRSTIHVHITITPHYLVCTALENGKVFCGGHEELRGRSLERSGLVCRTIYREPYRKLRLRVDWNERPMVAHRHGLAGSSWRKVGGKRIFGNPFVASKGNLRVRMKAETMR